MYSGQIVASFVPPYFRYIIDRCNSYEIVNMIIECETGLSNVIVAIWSEGCHSRRKQSINEEHLNNVCRHLRWSSTYCITREDFFFKAGKKTMNRKKARKKRKYALSLNIQILLWIYLIQQRRGFNQFKCTIIFANDLFWKQNTKQHDLSTNSLYKRKSISSVVQLNFCDIN